MANNKDFRVKNNIFVTGLGTSTFSGDVSIGDTITVQGAATFQDEVNLNSALNASSLSLSGNATISGNLTVSGTTTWLNSTNTQITDRNIVLNYSTGDSSGSANGAGITIQDAVNSTTDATILWNTSDNRFDFSNHIGLPDDKRIKLGDGNDLQIFHNSSNNHSVISESGSGDLRLNADDLYIKNASATENKAVFLSDGAVKLYYNNAEKIVTTSTGVDVTGAITSSGDIRANGGDYFTNSGAAGNYRGFGDRLGLSIVNGASYIYDAASIPVIGLAAYQGNIHIYNELKMGNLSGTTVIDSSRNLVNIGTITSGFISASTSDASSVPLSIGSGSSTNYTLQRWITSAHSGSTAYMIAYGASHSSQAGNFAMKNIASGGEIFFELQSGVEPLRLTSTGATFAGTISTANGTESLPAYTFSSDTDTGMFSDTANQLEFSTGGDSKVTINPSGHLLCHKGEQSVLNATTTSRGIWVSNDTNGESVSYNLALPDGTNNRRATISLDDSTGLWVFNTTASSGVPDIVFQRANTEKGRFTSSGLSVSGAAAISGNYNTSLGGYQINGATVIDSSRNLTNIASISATEFTGHIEAGGHLDFNIGVNHGTTGDASTWWISQHSTGQTDVPGTYYDIINLSSATTHGIQLAARYGSVDDQFWIRSRSDNSNAPAGVGLQAWKRLYHQDHHPEADTLTTARTIGGVSFDGSANIDLPGVNTTGNQNTSGTSAGLSGTPNITVGTISSGAITSTALSIETGAPILTLKDTTDDDDHQILFKDNGGTVRYQITSAGDQFNFATDGSREIVFKPSNTEKFRVGTAYNESKQDIRITTGGLRIGSSTVIDSTKNLLNINTINLGGELNFTGNGNKYIDVETLALSNALTIRHHNPSGNLFETAMIMYANGGTIINYDGSGRLSTTSAGASITGSLNITSAITHTTHGTILDSSANLTNINNVYASGYRIGSTQIVDSSRNLTNIGTISNSGNITSTGSAHTFYSGGGTGEIAVGRSVNQEIEIFVDDTNNKIIARQDSDDNGTHRFILDRYFAGTGANDFHIRKDGTNQLTIDTNANATFAGDITLGANGIIDTASGHLIFKGNGVTAGQFTSTGFSVVGNTAISGNYNTSLGGYQVGGTTVIDSSRNLQNLESIVMPDNKRIKLGTGEDLHLNHNGTNSFIQNKVGTFYIDQEVTDGNMLFRNDNGSGGLTAYMTLEGGNERVSFNKKTIHHDNVLAVFGSDQDLQIYHNGTDSFIDDAGSGDLRIRSSFLKIEKYTGETMAFFNDDNSVGLYFNNSKKFETTSTGIDVTGTAVVDGLTSSGQLYVNTGDGVGSSGGIRLREGSNQSHRIYPDNQNQYNSIGSSDPNWIWLQEGGDTNAILNDSGFDLKQGAYKVNATTVIDSSRNLLNLESISLADNKELRIGSGNDLVIDHNGTDSIIKNNEGDLVFKQEHDDKDIIFQADNGSGGVVEYLRFDGSHTRITANKDLVFFDNIKANFGTSSDLQIYHDGSNSYIKDAGTGTLRILSDDVRIMNAAGTEISAQFIQDGEARLKYDNVTKLATKSTGIDVTGTTVTDILKTDGGTYAAGVDTQTDAALVIPQTKKIYSLNSSGNYLRNIFYHDGNNGHYIFGQTGTSLIADMLFYAGSSGNFRFYASGSEDVRIDTSGNVNLKTGALQINGSQVITSSRNLTNIGTISSGAITSSNILTVDYTAPIIRLKPDNGAFFQLRANESPARLELGHSSNKNLYLSNTGNATFNYELNVVSNFKINGTTVIDASRNLTNIGTISSGAITSSGSDFILGSSAILTKLRSISNSGFTDTVIENYSSGAYRERLRFTGSTILAGITSSVGVGGTPADANSIELGRGYINLARDDTASAKQITFGKNGSVHSSIETTTSQFKINSSVNTLNFTGTTYSINGFETVRFTSSGGYEFGDLSEDDRDVTIRAFANTAKITMTDGSVAITGALSKSSGSFKIDHPLKPDTHDLVHSFVEGPQADNLYRGKINLVDGRAVIDLDEWFGMTPGTFLALNRDLQAFVSNEEDWDAVRAKVMGSQLVIECQNARSKASVSWLVVGERQDNEIYESTLTDDYGKIIVEPVKQVVE